MAVPLPEAARTLIEGAAVAHVVTIDPDGSPHVTAAWVGLDGEEVVLATLSDQRKLRNLRRDPRIAYTARGCANLSQKRRVFHHGRRLQHTPCRRIGSGRV